MVQECCWVECCDAATMVQECCWVECCDAADLWLRCWLRWPVGTNGSDSFFSTGCVTLCCEVIPCDVNRIARVCALLNDPSVWVMSYRRYQNSWETKY